MKKWLFLACVVLVLVIQGVTVFCAEQDKTSTSSTTTSTSDCIDGCMLPDPG